MLSLRGSFCWVCSCCGTSRDARIPSVLFQPSSWFTVHHGSSWLGNSASHPVRRVHFEGEGAESLSWISFLRVRRAGPTCTDDLNHTAVHTTLLSVINIIVILELGVHVSPPCKLTTQISPLSNMCAKVCCLECCRGNRTKTHAFFLPEQAHAQIL